MGKAELRIEIDEALLRRRVDSIVHLEDEIRRALDRLFTGF